MLIALLLIAASAGAPQATTFFGDAALEAALGPPRTEVGSWADYAVRTKGARDVRLRISVVPPALPEGRYWLEVVTIASDGAATAVKLRTRGDPSDPRNIDRLYLQVSGQAPIDVPLDQLPERKPLPRRRGKVTHGAPARVQVRAGTFDRAEPLRAGPVRVWRAASVPLWGLIKAQTPRQSVELLGSGTTGAHSTFPEGFDDQGTGKESMK